MLCVLPGSHEHATLKHTCCLSRQISRRTSHWYSGSDFAGVAVLDGVDCLSIVSGKSHLLRQEIRRRVQVQV